MFPKRVISNCMRTKDIQNPFAEFRLVQEGEEPGWSWTKPKRLGRPLAPRCELGHPNSPGAECAECARLVQRGRDIAELTIERRGRPLKGDVVVRAEPSPRRPKYSKTKEKQREYNDKTMARHGRRYRLAKYRLTPELFSAMLAAQNHQCLLCEAVISEETQLGPRQGGLSGYRKLATATTVCVDHCHVTGKVRGLLCMLCNRGLGDFKDDPDRMRRAADYLERHRG